jgi:hypothetical protein
MIDLDSHPLSHPGRRSPLSPPAIVTPADDTPERDAILRAGPGARMLVEAGPGTGKTQMAALRLAGLIRTSVSPGQILVLSFSRSAVRTLTKRLAVVAEADPQVIEELRHVSIRTFDSWAFRMLRLLGEPPGFLLGRGYDDNIAALTAHIEGPQREDVRRLIGDRRHLIVDEFQDLPGVRGDLVLALLDLLAPPGEEGCGFTILGDPAQAIYGFAARTKDGKPWPTPQQYWKRVEKLYGAGLEVKSLWTNYRANTPLAALAAELREVLLRDLPKEEKRQVVREKIEALPIPDGGLDPSWLSGPGSRAILTRTNGEAVRVLQKLLGKDCDGPDVRVRLSAGGYAGLPPAWIGALLRPLRSPTVTHMQFLRIHAKLTTFWDKDVQRRLELPDAETAWKRLAWASGAGEEATMIEIAALRARLAWPDAFPDDQQMVGDELVVTTIHQSKGMEFDIVTVLEHSFVPDDNEAEAANEEANVAYVAVTRAAQALNRLPPTSIYAAPTQRDFQDGRTRLSYWWRGWINLAMGLGGDVDSTGFVDPALHGGREAVELVQQYLLTNASALEGRKVMLCKSVPDGDVVYNIHLQVDTRPGLLIGRTGKQLTLDLLNLLWEKGYQLPGRIMNLRISRVGTATSEGDLPLEEPDRISRLWLGVSLFGTGDFQPRRRN